MPNRSLKPHPLRLQRRNHSQKPKIRGNRRLRKRTAHLIWDHTLLSFFEAQPYQLLWLARRTLLEQTGTRRKGKKDQSRKKVAWRKEANLKTIGEMPSNLYR